MKKYFLATILFWVTSAIAAPSITPVAPKLVDGCYQIGTAAELYGFAAITNGTDGMARNTAACGKLTADIVVNQNVLANDTLNGDGSNFIPWTPIEEFSGTFDGQFHTISGLYYSYKIDDQEEHNWAAFILSARPAREGDTVFIKNLGIEDSYIFNYRYAAGILASIDTGTVAMINVYFASWVYGWYGTPGGLVGNAHKGPLYVKNSYSLAPEPMLNKVCAIGGGYSETRKTIINTFGSSELNLYTSTNESRVPYSNHLDGSVAQRLHNFTDGSAWGQNVGVDKHPVFSGKVTNYAGDLTVSKLTLNAGVEHEPYPEGYVEGELMQLPIPERDGYAFIGWFENEDFTTDTILGITYKTTGDKELYALWAPLPKMADGCYQIGTEGELYGFAAIVNGTNGTEREKCACGKLTANIKINDTTYTKNPYKQWFPMMDFCGTFDGNGKSISGLYKSRPNDKDGRFGLFGTTRERYISYDERYRAVIKDLEVLSAYFYSDTCIGVLIGDGEYVDIINVHTSGSVHGRYAIGGLAGRLRHASITHSSNTAGGDARAAGGSLIGETTGNVFISNTFNKGTLSDNSNHPIGMIGRSSGTTIENSYHMPHYWKPREAALVAEEYCYVKAINTFYDGPYQGEYGTHVTTREFNDGTVAKLLREYKSDSTGTDGSVWGQNVGVDDAPVFKDEFLFSSVVVPATPKTSDGCYMIGTVEELFGFANIVNTALYNITPFCAKLTSDIALNEDTPEGVSNPIQWIPIRDFDGTFDGQGHTLSGIYFDDSTTVNAGLFSSVRNQDPLAPTTIKNLNIVDSYIRGGNNTGALIGKIDTLSMNVIIENCQVNAIVANGYLYNETQYQSGLIAEHVSGNLTIRQSSSVTKLEGLNGYTGGFIAQTRTRDTVNIVNSFAVSNADLIGTTPSLVYYGTTPVVAHINVENTYTIGTANNSDEWGYSRIIGVCGSVPITLRNTYHIGDLYRGISDTTSLLDIEATEEQFRNGTVAYALHMYKSKTADGSVWGQQVGIDKYPKLTGTISGAASVKLSPLHLVTYDSDTATYNDTYIEGIENVLPEPVRENYTFRGWYSNQEFTGKPKKFIPSDASGEQTFYARWWHIPDVVENCYMIGDAGELYQFAEDFRQPHKHGPVCIKLTADITVNKNVLVDGNLSEDTASFATWTPLENFSGIIDGQGHSISGLYLQLPYSETVGFISTIGKQYNKDTTFTTIKDLSIKDTYVRGYKYVGTLIGTTYGAATLNIINVSNEGIVSSAGSFTGGLIGEFNGGEDSGNTLNLVNVHNKGNVSGYNYVGGIAGAINKSRTSIIDVSSSGKVFGHNGIGGLVGEMTIVDSTSTIAYSFNEGLVSGYMGVAGLVGYQSTPLKIYNSYNVGDISIKDSLASGMVCWTTRSTAIINSYNKGLFPKDTLSDALVAFVENDIPTIDNVYYINSATSVHGGTAITAEEFTDLSLAKKLHDYNKDGIDGEAWKQAAGDPYPTFDQDVVKAFVAKFIATLPEPEITSESSSSESSSSSKAEESSSSETESRSSEAKSSSSETGMSSSSSIPESSSSKGDGGSEAAMTSSSAKSSSSNAESSSSSAKSSSSSTKSSSSQKQTGIIAGINKPIDFSVTPVADHILVSGAPLGSKVSLLDMQGRILYQGRIANNGFTIKVPNAGVYIVRVQNTNKIVKTGL